MLPSLIGGPVWLSHHCSRIGAGSYSSSSTCPLSFACGAALGFCHLHFGRPSILKSTLVIPQKRHLPFSVHA
jgi:hypothetical protein